MCRYSAAAAVGRAAREEAAEVRGEDTAAEEKEREAAAAAELSKLTEAAAAMSAAAGAADAAAPRERMLSPLEAAAAQDSHDDWQRERDPAVPMFASYFGKAWAERMAHEVLFPHGLAVAELEEKEKSRMASEVEKK